MSERGTGSGRIEGGSGDNLDARAQNARSGVATLVCILGLLIAVGSAVATIFAGVGADVISGGVIGIALGILGYFLGAGKLGVATVLAMFAGLIVNQLIPGVGGDERELPGVEPGSSEG